jgi:hypothetical protein
MVRMSTLADHLRALPDDGLAALIRLRPDLVIPLPGDLSALAVRAQSRLSVARALDGLDRFTIEVLDAVRYLRPDPSLDAVLALTAQGGAEPARVRAAIDTLRTLALVHGPDQALHVVGTIDEVMAFPAGLGRSAHELDPAAAVLAADPAGLRRTVLGAPPAARAVLDRLAAGPPLGAVATPLAEDSPVRYLLDHHLLVRVGDDTVELPREMALVLRRDAGPLGPLHPEPPSLAGVSGSARAARETQKKADRAGAGQALEVVRQAEALLDALAEEPATELRTGGLGVRDLRRVARTAGLDEPTAALVLEVTHAAGLLGDDENGFMPTTIYDAWQVAPLAMRWRMLATAWFGMPRSAGLVGQRDDRDRLIAALSPEVERLGAPAARRAVFEVLAGLPEGVAPTAEEVAAVLAWRSPRRHGRNHSLPVAGILGEAAALGFTALGMLTSYTRPLLAEQADPDDDPLGVEDTGAPDAAAVLDALLPPPVDAVLIQADLSVVVPGPPEPGLAAELSLVADAESASVLRITASSVRRALDAGFSATDLHALFARRSRTPVPQALTYLVDDVARRHGGLRAGTAAAYLRSEDEALIAEVQADRRLAQLGLRRLAPTVLITSTPPARLLEALRAAGYAPVREDAGGAAVLARPKTRRAPSRPPLTVRREDPLAMPSLGPARLGGVVEQLRRGDAAARAARRAPLAVRTATQNGTQAHGEAMVVLQQAVRDKARVWVGYVDAHGSSMSRLVRPVSIGAGYLRAEDERTETLHTFALHRITAAELET